MKHIVKKFIGAVVKLSVMAVLAEVFFESLSEPGDGFPYAYYFFAEMFIYHLIKAIAESCDKENVLPVIRYALFASSISILGVLIAGWTGINAYTVLVFLYVGYSLNTVNPFSTWRFFRSQLDDGKTKYDFYKEDKQYREKASGYGPLK